MKTQFAKILAGPPGPKSRALLERKTNALALGAYHNFPIFIESAKNALLVDVDGNQYIDFAGGIGVMNVGHGNENVATAVQAQLKKFTHVCFHATMFENYVAVAEKMNAIAPGDFPKKSFLVNSGAEAVENAVKIARYATQRRAVIAFQHSFHGRTHLGMALTGKVKPYKAQFGTPAPDVYHLPFPYCYRCSRSPGKTGECCMNDPQFFDDYFKFAVDPADVAAIIFEPVLGEGGFLPINRNFLKTLAAFAKEHGILLIADEIQTGWGRTGKLFAMEHFDLAPDILVTAKSMGGGLPISAVTGRAEIMDAVPPGSIGSTYGGNPVSCAAALAAIDFIQTKNLPERAVKIGETVRAAFHRLQRKHDFIGDVRGIGAMNALEFVLDPQSKKPAPEHVLRIQKKSFENGLIVLKAGAYGHVIRTLMPLTIEFDVLEEGLGIFEQVLEA